MQDYTFIVTFLSMGIVVLILAARSIMFQNEIDKLKRADKKIKEDFCNEWTRLVMEDVDYKIASIKSSKNLSRRDEHGKFVKSGDSKPAL